VSELLRRPRRRNTQSERITMDQAVPNSVATTGEGGDTAVKLDGIVQLLPHRPPFLFVDAVTRVVAGERIATRRSVRADESWFAGHFPGDPVMPGVLITDALAQTAGLLWGLSEHHASPDQSRAGRFYLAAAKMKFLNTVRPEDTLDMDAVVDNTFGSLHSYHVEARVGRRIIARGNVTLAMMEGDV
jgi:3-hydroxyacyl-[acyl-carrier-protein] dehydratase